MSDQAVHYRPARSVVAISGTVTITTEGDGHQQATRTTDVTLATEADVRDRWQVELKEGHFGRDREFDLKLSADERLSGATTTSTGVGTELLAAGIRIAALAATVAPVVFGLREGEVPPSLEIDVQFAVDHPELAERRDRYRDIVSRLDAELQRLADEVATEPPPPDFDSHLQAVESALAVASNEAATIEAQFEQWLDANYPPWIRHYSYLVGIDELPVIANVTDETSFTNLTGTVAEVAQTVGIVVARVGDHATTEHQPDSNGTSAISFRFPRRITLAVYEVADMTVPSDNYRLRNVIPAWVVDRFSELGSVDIESHLFHTDGATIEFGDAGALVHLANKETSAAGAIATTLSSAGAAVTESIEQGTKIANALKPADSDLRALTDEVTRKELQARLVTANKTIAGAPTTAGTPTMSSTTP
jgi:hypothetical protein